MRGVPSGQERERQNLKFPRPSSTSQDALGLRVSSASTAPSLLRHVSVGAGTHYHLIVRRSALPPRYSQHRLLQPVRPGPFDVSRRKTGRFLPRLLAKYAGSRISQLARKSCLHTPKFLAPRLLCLATTAPVQCLCHSSSFISAANVHTSPSQGQWH